MITISREGRKLASYTDALKAKGIAGLSNLISGDEKAAIARQSKPFYALDGAMNEPTKFGAAHRLDVELDGKKRSMYFSPGDHIDDVINAILEMAQTEPVGPMTLYEYDTAFGSKGFGLEELVTSHATAAYHDDSGYQYDDKP